MIRFADKNGRRIEIRAVFASGTSSSALTAEEILLSLLEKAPQEEFLELPQESTA